MQRKSWKVANPHLVCKENVNYPLNVKKELEMIAEALIDGSLFSGLLPWSTALQQNLVISKVQSKDLMMNILAAVHFA